MDIEAFPEFEIKIPARTEDPGSRIEVPMILIVRKAMIPAKSCGESSADLVSDVGIQIQEVKVLLLILKIQPQRESFDKWLSFHRIRWAFWKIFDTCSPRKLLLVFGHFFHRILELFLFTGEVIDGGLLCLFRCFFLSFFKREDCYNEEEAKKN